MFKVYVAIKDESDEEYKHELDGVLYPDTLTAHEAIDYALYEDHIKDKFDVVGWSIEEV